MNGRHIFNARVLAEQVGAKRGNKEANVYEKVNQLMKGAVIGTPELLEAVEQVAEAEVKRLKAHLRMVRKQLQAAAAA